MFLLQIHENWCLTDLPEVLGESLGGSLGDSLGARRGLGLLGKRKVWDSSGSETVENVQSGESGAPKSTKT